ncbi:MAG: S8 family serine peptidase [Thermoflexales bacterium]
MRSLSLRWLLSMVLLTLGLSSSPVRAVDDLATDQPPIQRLIIKFRDPPASRAQQDVAPGGVWNSEALSLVSRAAGEWLTDLRVMGGGAHVVQLRSPRSITEARRIAARIQALPQVEYAEPDLWLQPLSVLPNDPLFSSQWHYALTPTLNYGINLPPAWALITGSASIVVAVIDTGVLFNHPDFSGKLLPGYDFISDVTVANDGDGRDNDASDPGDWTGTGSGSGCPPNNCPSSWHGTHVAGTISAATNNGLGVAGVGWGTPILPVRVLGSGGGMLSDVADGILWAAGLSVPDVPDNPHPAKVLNLSLGGFSPTCPNTLQSAINAARAQGALIVAAAGNNPFTQADSFTPANCANTLTVAATNKVGNRTWYSSVGSVVAIAAPGGDSGGAILSTGNSGTTSPAAHTYTYKVGTSMAAPHVAGVAALVWSANPALTPAQVTFILTNTATPFPFGSSCAVGCGSGIVNAYRAVSAALLPQPFSKLSPPDGSGQQPLSGTLSWSASIGATSYALCGPTTNVADCANAANYISVGNVTSITYTGLLSATPYFWQVRAVNPNGVTYADGGIGAQSTFTTMLPPVAFLPIVLRELP